MKANSPDLINIEMDCWQRMTSGTSQLNHPFRTAVVGSTDADKVYMRTIVVRKVNTITKQVYFYTDTRSGKWAQLQHQPNTSLLLHDLFDHTQIRLAGKASFHQSDALADEQWSRTGINNRRNYLSQPGPSIISPVATDGLSAADKRENLSLAETEKGRKNFGVVVIAVDWMEWLWLNRDGHRRATFSYATDGSFTASWLIP